MMLKLMQCFVVLQCSNLWHIPVSGISPTQTLQTSANTHTLSCIPTINSTSSLIFLFFLIKFFVYVAQAYYSWHVCCCWSQHFSAFLPSRYSHSYTTLVSLNFRLTLTLYSCYHTALRIVERNDYCSYSKSCKFSFRVLANSSFC